MTSSNIIDNNWQWRLENFPEKKYNVWKVIKTWRNARIICLYFINLKREGHEFRTDTEILLHIINLNDWFTWLEPVELLSLRIELSSKSSVHVLSRTWPWAFQKSLTVPERDLQSQWVCRRRRSPSFHPVISRRWLSSVCLDAFVGSRAMLNVFNFRFCSLAHWTERTLHPLAQVYSGLLWYCL